MSYKKLALSLGFDRVSVTNADAATADAKNLLNWFTDGHAAGMGWLGRAPLDRGEPKKLLPQALSVITLGVSYHTGVLPPAPGGAYGRVARYAWGLDYHEVLEERLNLYRQGLVREYGANVLSVSTVDIHPLLERAFSRRSGLGFIGKNTNLIAPGSGSFFFLATVLVNLDLPMDSPVKPGFCNRREDRDEGGRDSFDEKSEGHGGSMDELSEEENVRPPSSNPASYCKLRVKPRCGGCSVCQSRCTSGALQTPFSLDSRRCVSYHTIENRGPIPLEFREKTGDWLFGCDDCQDPCPYNVRPLETRWPEWSDPKGPGPWVRLSDVLMTRTNEDFRRRFFGTSLLRAKRAGLIRNACLVASNRGAVDELRSELLDVLVRDPAPTARGASAWALGRTKTSWAKRALERALLNEQDLSVREEITRGLC